MPLDALQQIITDPDFANVSQDTRRQLLQKISRDPDVQKLSIEDRNTLGKQILFPNQPEPGQEEPKKGFFQHIGEEVKSGVKQMLNPSQTPYLGSETLGEISPVARNIVGSALGAGRAIYSIPTAAGQKLGDTLESAGVPKEYAQTIGNVAGVALPMVGGGVPTV